MKVSVSGFNFIHQQRFASPDNLHIQAVILRATHETGLHITLTVTAIVGHIDAGLMYQVDNTKIIISTGSARPVLNQSKFMVVTDTGQRADGAIDIVPLTPVRLARIVFIHQLFG